MPGGLRRYHAHNGTRGQVTVEPRRKVERVCPVMCDGDSH